MDLDTKKLIRKLKKKHKIIKKVSSTVFNQNNIYIYIYIYTGLWVTLNNNQTIYNLYIYGPLA